MSNLLLDAFRLAMDAHGGDWYGTQPYIYHPLDVAERVANYGDHTIAVALLHDALEENPFGFSDIIKASMPWEVYYPVMVLTHLPDESYYDYVRRIRASGSAISVTVKIADIESNLEHGPKPSLIPRYKTALEVLRNERN